MTDINSDGFRRRAYEAAAQARKQEADINASVAALAAAEASKHRAAQRQENDLRSQVDKERVAGRQLARLALQRGVMTNRSWVTAYRPGIGLVRWLQRGTVMAEGWMLIHKDSSRKMDDGEMSLFGTDLILTTSGELCIDGIGHSGKVGGLRAPYKHELPHPNPAEYMRDLMSTTTGNTPWQGFTLEDVRLGLAEFAGLNRLV